MESYGEILKNKREEKNIEIETAVRETSISRKYIEALEKEQEQDFPGEPYLIGFLRNYSDYLEVNTEEVLRLYKAKRIQETPVPVQLLEKKRPKWVIPLIVTSVLLLLIAVGLWLYFIILDIPAKMEEKQRALAESKQVHSYQIKPEVEKIRLYKGDQLLIPSLESPGKFDIVTVSGCLGKLILDTPTGRQVVDYGETRDLDINADGKAELNVYTEDVSDRNEAFGAQIRVFLSDAELAAVSDYTVIPDDDSETPAQAPVQAAATTSTTSRKGTVVYETNSGKTAYPFAIEIVFRGACFFRYKTDSDPYIEAYYRPGETLSLSAKNGFRFWMSNSNALSIRVIANATQRELDIGRAGEVKVQDLKWIFEDGTYKIAVIDLD